MCDDVGCGVRSWPTAAGTPSSVTDATAHSTASAPARHTPPSQLSTAHAPAAHASSACTFGPHTPAVGTHLGWSALPPNASGSHQAGGWGRGQGWGCPAWPYAHAAGALTSAEVSLTCAGGADPCPAGTASSARHHAAGCHAASTRCV